MSRDFLLQIFFMNHLPPLGSIWIFSIIRGHIRKSRCNTVINNNGGKVVTGVAIGKISSGINDTALATNLPPVSMTPAANFATSSASVIDTGSKFAASVVDTGGKFATGVNDTGGAS
jgi:hypothetical protein